MFGNPPSLVVEEVSLLTSAPSAPTWLAPQPNPLNEWQCGSRSLSDSEPKGTCPERSSSFPDPARRDLHASHGVSGIHDAAGPRSQLGEIDRPMRRCDDHDVVGSQHITIPGH
jgi:hypothetical protein